MLQKFLRLSGLSGISFSPRKNFEIDFLMAELRDEFREPYSISRCCKDNNPYIKVLMVVEAGQEQIDEKLKSDMQARAAGYPIEFNTIVIHSLSNLFDRLRQIAAERI